MDRVQSNVPHTAGLNKAIIQFNERIVFLLTPQQLVQEPR
jgi:hypothetical protein